MTDSLCDTESVIIAIRKVLNHAVHVKLGLVSTMNSVGLQNYLIKFNIKGLNKNACGETEYSLIY